MHRRLLVSVPLALILSLLSLLSFSTGVHAAQLGSLKVVAPGIPVIERLYVINDSGVTVKSYYNYNGEQIDLPAGSYKVVVSKAYMKAELTGVTITEGGSATATIPTKQITATFTGSGITNDWRTVATHLGTADASLNNTGGVQSGWQSAEKSSVSYTVFNNNQTYVISVTKNNEQLKFYVPPGQTEGLTKVAVTAPGIPTIERVYAYNAKGAQAKYLYGYKGETILLLAGTYTFKGNNAGMTYQLQDVTIIPGKDNVVSIPTKVITATFEEALKGYNFMGTVSPTGQEVGVKWGWEGIQQVKSYTVFDNGQTYIIKAMKKDDTFATRIFEP
jgi:hypothetical protein